MAGEGKILLNNVRNFRKWILNEGVGASRIEQAIKAHETLYVYYVGDERSVSGYRTIKPFVMGDLDWHHKIKGTAGENNGIAVVRAWQDAGSSDSYKREVGVKPRLGHEKISGPHGTQPGWRLFKIDKITSLIPTGTRFHPEKYFNAGGVAYNPMMRI